MKTHRLLTAAAITLTITAVAVPAAGAAGRTQSVRHAARHARTLSFYATVVRANAKGLVVRTDNGRTLRFSAAQITRKRSPSAKPHAKLRKHHGRRGHVLRAASDSTTPTGPVAINIIGLQPGVTVLITETVATDGTLTITITLPPLSANTPQNATGVVTDVEDDVFVISTGDGADLRLHMAADQLSNLNLGTCDTVTVTYHQDAGMLIADSARVTGSSASGDCAPTYDASGAVTAVSATSITITADQGSLTFAVADPGLTDGFQPGDVVDVTYTQNSDGSLSATNVAYVETDASGIVTSVSSSRLTITDSSTGQSEVFIADPASGLQLSTYAFDGMHVGDQADVNYHQTAAGLVADSVDDQPPGS